MAFWLPMVWVTQLVLELVLVLETQLVLELVLVLVLEPQLVLVLVPRLVLGEFQLVVSQRLKPELAARRRLNPSQSSL
jgi:hypothetical protein